MEYIRIAFKTAQFLQRIILNAICVQRLKDDYWFFYILEFCTGKGQGCSPRPNRPVVPFSFIRQAPCIQFILPEALPVLCFFVKIIVILHIFNDIVRNVFWFNNLQKNIFKNLFFIYSTIKLWFRFTDYFLKLYLNFVKVKQYFSIYFKVS